jgi:outer membrane protein
VAACALAPGLARAQSSTSPWTFATRAVMTGSSDPDRSDPKGYEFYSAFAIEAAVQRRLGSRFALETSLRTESREVTFQDAPAGSIEVLPVNVILQYRPPIGDRVRPYVGAGLNLSVVWEKAGALDSTDLAPSIAPAVQLGVDVRLTPRLFLNLDVRWHPWRTDVEADGETLARLQIDPLALGAGIGFRF